MSAHKRIDRYRIEDRGHETPCWIWNLSTDGRGLYPQVKYEGRTQQAHRVEWERRHGRPLPGGHSIELHHLCEQTLCVNPDHLEPLPVLDHRREHSGASMDIARAVRARYEPRVVTAPMLAAEFGITPKQVRHIVAGRVWRERE